MLQMDIYGRKQQVGLVQKYSCMENIENWETENDKFHTCYQGNLTCPGDSGGAITHEIDSVTYLKAKFEISLFFNENGEFSFNFRIFKSKIVKLHKVFKSVLMVQWSNLSTRIT